jgi:hypothetical protein
MATLGATSLLERVAVTPNALGPCSGHMASRYLFLTFRTRMWTSWPPICAQSKIKNCTFILNLSPPPPIPITCYMNTLPNNLFCKAPLGWFRKAANSALIEDSYRLHLCPIWAHCASNIMVPVCAYTGSYSSPHKGLVHVHGTGPHMWPIVGDC